MGGAAAQSAKGARSQGRGTCEERSQGVFRHTVQPKLLKPPVLTADSTHAYDINYRCPGAMAPWLTQLWALWCQQTCAYPSLDS